MAILMKVADLFTTPQGLVINGTNQEFSNIQEPELRNLLRSLTSFWFTDPAGISHQLNLIDTKITTSIGDIYNLHLLVENNSLSKLLTIGQTIYYEQIEEDSSQVKSHKILTR